MNDEFKMSQTRHSFSPDLLDIHINENEINCKVNEIVKHSDTLGDLDKINLLTKAICFMDLTTLNANDTAQSIQVLCEKASGIKSPITQNNSVYPAAICVYPLRIKDVLQSLKTHKIEHKINVASVAAGFPSGQYPLETRLQEICFAVEYGATEIDVVINRSLAVTHQWEELYQEIESMRKACGVCMKTILATGELADLDNVYKASMVSMMAGSDFIKTSTGKEAVNATLPVGITMCKAIRDYYEKFGRKVGLKPAGGIKTANDALQWITLVKSELGDEWLTSKLFRIGASSLLDNIIIEIERLMGTQ